MLLGFLNETVYLRVGITVRLYEILPMIHYLEKSVLIWTIKLGLLSTKKIWKLLKNMGIFNKSSSNIPSELKKSELINLFFVNSVPDLQPEFSTVTNDVVFNIIHPN